MKERLNSAVNNSTNINKTNNRFSTSLTEDKNGPRHITGINGAANGKYKQTVEVNHSKL